MVNFAIIESGGKQYKVEPGMNLKVEAMAVESGSDVELGSVLAISKDGKLSLGNPIIEGVKVVAEVIGQTRGRKLIVFKYKAKTRYRKKNGHRQTYTNLLIKDILTDQKGTTATKAKEELEETNGS
jgi:large subunit ribosomal protein L21